MSLGLSFTGLEDSLSNNSGDTEFLLEDGLTVMAVEFASTEEAGKRSLGLGVATIGVLLFTKGDDVVISFGLGPGDRKGVDTDCGLSGRGVTAGSPAPALLWQSGPCFVNGLFGAAEQFIVTLLNK